MQRAQEYLGALWRYTPQPQPQPVELTAHDIAAWRALSASIPPPLRYVARAVECYHRAGWDADGEFWQNWCVENYRWQLTEQAFLDMEANPTPLWDVPSAYTDLAEDCIWRAMQGLRESGAPDVEEQERQLGSLVRLWRECALAGGRTPRQESEEEIDA